MEILVTGMLAAVFWIIFLYHFNRDRSRYRNCYLLILALIFLVPFILCVSGPFAGAVAVGMLCSFFIALLIVPVFLILNGITMMRKEGRHLSHMLSFGLGLAILLGEVATVINVLIHLNRLDIGEMGNVFQDISRISALIMVTVVYGSSAFLVFMIYTLFLHVIPRKRDFDYVIIHGAGLLQGDRVSKLLKDRLDKAVEVYRKDPTPPKLIPSGGQGADETISEAEAMKRYLLEQGIPEDDIIPEDESKTTFENLKNSKRILDGYEGRKYTALVTSNYHVYRALRYCRKIGLACTGIGSRVAFYYWPNALIREFIAIHAEKKHAVMFIGGWVLCMGLMSLAIW